jgi:SAM-dependent methyltransferase
MYSKTSEFTKSLLEDTILLPVNEIFNQGILENPNFTSPYTSEAIAIKWKQRNVILEQGRTDFNSESNGLTLTQKVDLYCFYYFQMHYSSSHILYRGLTKPNLGTLLKDKEVYFIDIGCGPFTSGLAFNRFLQNTNLGNTITHYIGIDSSTAMIEKAKFICSKLNDKRYSDIVFYSQIPNLISSFPKTQNMMLILNYSYFFGSQSLIVKDFIDFTNLLVASYPESKILVFHQNPTGRSLNVKWEEYKKGLPNLNSIPGCPTKYVFEYDDILKSSNREKLDLRCYLDVLTSFEI